MQALISRLGLFPTTVPDMHVAADGTTHSAISGVQEIDVLLDHSAAELVTEDGLKVPLSNLNAIMRVNPT